MAYRSRSQAFAAASAAALLLTSLLLTGCDGSRPFVTPPPLPEAPIGGGGDSELPDADPDDEDDAVLIIEDVDVFFDELLTTLNDDAVTLVRDPASFEDLLLDPDNAELLMSASDFAPVAEAHALVAAAEDPDPEWMFTASRMGRVNDLTLAVADDSLVDDEDAPLPDDLPETLGFRLVEPGATYVIDYLRLDAETAVIGPLRAGDRARLRVEARLQRDDDRIVVLEGAERTAIIDWHPTQPQRLLLTRV